MMTPEEVDQLAGISAEAAKSETGKRLYCAIITDALFNRILGDHPDPGAVADELGNDGIVDIARKELEALTEEKRDRLADFAADHLRHLIVGVGKPAFKAMKNGILDSDDLTPDFLICAAAVACVAQATK
jgi:hypothetical protein